MIRSANAILIDTVRNHAKLVETYFTAKRDGADEFTLRRIQRVLEDSAVGAIAIADSAEALSAAFAAVADLRLVLGGGSDVHAAKVADPMSAVAFDRWPILNESPDDQSA